MGYWVLIFNVGPIISTIWSRCFIATATDSLCKILNTFQVLGIDSEFCNVEALVTGIVDNWPEYLLKHRRIFTIGICVFMFALGVPMCTEGGVFLFQLMDFYRCALTNSLCRSEA